MYLKDILGSVQSQSVPFDGWMAGQQALTYAYPSGFSKKKVPIVKKKCFHGQRIKNGGK
jgi:hypothetical protein